MAGKRREPARAVDPMDEVARLLARNLKRERRLQEVIVELDSVGIRQARIAELLGTTGGYVNVALTRAKDQAKKKSTSRGKPAGATRSSSTDTSSPPSVIPTPGRPTGRATSFPTWPSTRTPATFISSGRTAASPAGRLSRSRSPRTEAARGRRQS